jgi:ribosome maturation protein SDO1
MSRQINQPSNHIKLTNVSLVRLKKGKKRFEIACYKNKVLEWRQGIETDLDNVLQIPNVFLNVSKGQTAPKDDLEKAFGKNKSVDDCVLEILNKGELQVGNKERAEENERMHHEVVSIVASRLVDPTSKKVYSFAMIAKALDMLASQAHNTNVAAGSGPATPAAGEEGEAHPRPKEHQWTGVLPNRSAKSQAQEATKALITHQPIPVMRARMKLRINCSTSVLKQPVKAKAAPTKEVDGDDDSQHKKPGTVKETILGFFESVESQEVVGSGSDWELVGFIEPGSYKALSEFVNNETRGKGRIEILGHVTDED